MYGFQPKIDVLNTGGYTKLGEIFEDMKSDRLGKSSRQASAAP
jgi:hypothetical protein